MHIDAGKIRRKMSDGGVDIGGGEGSAPGAVIPAVPPDRPTGVSRDIVGDQPQAMFALGGGSQVQAGELQTGGREMYVAVDERGCHERAVEVNGLSVGELRPSHRVVSQPGDHTVAYHHGGGIGVRRAVDKPVQQKCGHRASVTVQRMIGRLSPPSGPSSTIRPSTTSPSM